MRKIFFSLLIIFCILSLNGGVLKTGAKVTALPSPLFIDGSTRMLGDFLGKKFLVLYIFDLDKEALSEFYKVHDAVKLCQDIADFVGIGTGSVARLKKFPGVQQLGFPVNADKGEAKKLFLRERENLPLTVVLDKSGTLLWRGSVKVLPKILKECESGKFDLKERIRVEAFSDAVNEAISSEKFDIALSMLRKEFNANPKKLELLRVQLAVLKKLKRIDEAFKLIQDAEKIRPESYRIFEMEYMLYFQSFLPLHNLVHTH
jgi:tetratricopeptide (TPR) repeat protein